jgi:hypothetical protein
LECFSLVYVNKKLPQQLHKILIMDNSPSQTKTIQIALIAISLIALLIKNIIDQQYIEHQNEILKIIGLGGLSIANFIRAKNEVANSGSKKVSLILAGILGAIAIGNLLMLIYPALKNLL